MQKGFGFYSPHETTVLFLKATLVSIWVGLDLIVLFAVHSMAPSTIQRHLLLMAAAAVVLAAGTVFSLLFAWATGSLFGRPGPDGSSASTGGLVKATIETLKTSPYRLIGTGLAGAAIMLCVAWAALSSSLFSGDSGQLAGRANMAVAQKCSEVAELEKSLFRSDERLVMTQCMLQYDKTYTATRND